MDIKKRRFYKKVLYSKFTIVALLVIFVFVAKATWNAYGHVKVTRQNLATAQKNLLELENRKQFIEKETESLSSEGGIEEAIRESLPVVKEGERVVIIIDDKNLEEEEEEEVEDLRWWQRWWGSLFDR